MCWPAGDSYTAGAAYLLVALEQEENLMEKIGAYAVECPACQVPAGEKCTTPTDRSRRPVEWVHFAREALALEQQQEARR